MHLSRNNEGDWFPTSSILLSHRQRTSQFQESRWTPGGRKPLFVRAKWNCISTRINNEKKTNNTFQTQLHQTAWTTHFVLLPQSSRLVAPSSSVVVPFGQGSHAERDTLFQWRLVPLYPSAVQSLTLQNKDTKNEEINFGRICQSKPTIQVSAVRHWRIVLAQVQIDEPRRRPFFVRALGAGAADPWSVKHFAWSALCTEQSLFLLGIAWQIHSVLKMPPWHRCPTNLSTALLTETDINRCSESSVFVLTTLIHFTPEAFWLPKSWPNSKRWSIWLLKLAQIPKLFSLKFVSVWQPMGVVARVDPRTVRLKPGEPWALHSQPNQPGNAIEVATIPTRMHRAASVPRVVIVSGLIMGVEHCVDKRNRDNLERKLWCFASIAAVLELIAPPNCFAIPLVGSNFHLCVLALIHMSIHRNTFETIGSLHILTRHNLPVPVPMLSEGWFNHGQSVLLTSWNIPGLQVAQVPRMLKCLSCPLHNFAWLCLQDSFVRLEFQCWEWVKISGAGFIAYMYSMGLSVYSGCAYMPDLKSRISHRFTNFSNFATTEFYWPVIVESKKIWCSLSFETKKSLSQVEKWASMQILIAVKVDAECFMSDWIWKRN